MNLDLSKLADLAAQNQGTVKGRATAELPREKCLQVINNIKEGKKLGSDELALLLIAGLVQNGGSNRNASGAVTYSIGTANLSATEFATSVNTVQPKATPRQFCRTMRDEIAQAALALQEEGDLAKQMRLHHPSLTPEQAVWCSNFQTTNPNCPDIVRNWLMRNFEQRFR